MNSAGDDREPVSSIESAGCSRPDASVPADAEADLGIPIKPRLGMWDAVSIIIGIVVGTAIFKSPTFVFQNVAGPWQAMAVWLLGGILSLIGALCYAELATTYPRSGGDYEYLNRAYGRPVGFLFGWAQLVAILTGSIGAMAYAFADYAARLWQLPPSAIVWLAAAAVVVITVTNLLGVIAGKVTQNILSVTKIVGLIVVVIAGLAWGSMAEFAVPVRVQAQGLGLAMVFVLYAFGGWNDAAFVAAEVRDRRRNIPLALLLGISIITVVYLLVNAAFLLVLGFEGARQTMTPASDTLGRAWGEWGAKAVSVLVMISALGAINGMILTGSRIYASLGNDHRVFAWLGRWNQRRGAPVGALVAQAAFALALIFAVGTDQGRQAIDFGLAKIGLRGLPWDKYFGGFDTLVAGTAPIFWSFFLLTGVSMLILRKIDPDRERPFAAPLFPLTPLVFCGVCLYMLYSSLDYARSLALIGLVPLAFGLPLYWISQRAGQRAG